MYTLRKCRSVIALIVIHGACASCVHSYEQGSYFVFDIIESTETLPTKGRLAIHTRALAQAKTKISTAEEIERSEFEVNFKETIQPSTSVDSASELDPMARLKSITNPSRFRADDFSFEGSKSAFGE